VTIVPLLILLQRVIEDHARRQNSTKLEVIPVALEDLPRDQALLEEAIKRADGIFLEAQISSDGVSSRDHPGLKVAVETVLRFPIAGGDEDRILIQEDPPGLLKARFENRLTESSSPGEKTLLGVATALFDDRLNGKDLALLAYEEDSLDEEAKQAVWHLLTAQLQDLDLAPLRTLILVLQTDEVDVPRHCSGEASLRFAVARGDFLERRSWAASRVDIHQIAGSTPPLVLFLGAGFSVSSGLPMGDALRDFALASFHDDVESSPTDLARRFHQYVRESDRLLGDEGDLTEDEFVSRLTLERVLREELHRYSTAQSPTLRYFREEHDRALLQAGSSIRSLARVVETGRKLIIVTVNFDELLEQESPDAFRIFSSPADFAGASDYINSYLQEGGPVPYLKLHGTIRDPESVVATADQVAEGLGQPKTDALRRLFGSEDHPTRLVYAGYSMRDRDVVPVLAVDEGARLLEEEWVVPLPDLSIRRFITETRSQAWRASNRRESVLQRVITETADTFFKELESTWLPEVEHPLSQA
jgi:SIR2-like domain